MAAGAVMITIALVVPPVFAEIRDALSSDQMDHLGFILTGYSFAAVVLVVGMALWGSGRFSRGMHEISDHSDRVAQGRLRNDLVYESDDELGQVADSFREMTRGLRGLVSQLDSSASDVAASAEQLAASAQQMSASTQQVSSAAEAIATAAASQTRGVNKASDASGRVASRAAAVASHAEQARSAADVAQRTTRRGTIAADEALQAMAEISAVTGAAVPAVVGYNYFSNRVRLCVDIERCLSFLAGDQLQALLEELVRR